MSTDPREFEHPTDGTTPNELPTVLGVGSFTPEAIEAAARALSGCRAEQWESAAPHVKDSNRWAAQVALTAALPFIAAQAKGEALEEIACAIEKRRDEVANDRPFAKWETIANRTGQYRGMSNAAHIVRAAAIETLVDP